MSALVSCSSSPSLLSEKVVVVTGSSAGIGAAIAKHFANVGYRNLVLVYYSHAFRVLLTFISVTLKVARRKNKLEEVSAQCKANGAKRVRSA